MLYTFKASVWCLLNTSNYAEAVLKALNLGLDTDATSAVTGGLARLCYGHQAIPEHWKLMLARNKVADKFANKYERNN